MLTMDDTDLIAKIGKKRYRRRQERERYFTQAVDLSAVSASMGTTVAGNKLAQEISEEFLTCKICLDPFRSPKCLDCLHTFCEACIESHVLSEYSYKKYSDYREFTCPLCRKRTQLPLGGVKKLPDNFLVSSLGEVVARQKPSKFPFCDICKLVSRKHREAGSKCLDCNKLLCKACVDMHRDTKVTKHHSIFDCEIEKDIECKEHKEEVVRFFCEPCEACICVLCTFNEHKDHEITQFAQAVPKYKEELEKLLAACKTQTETYDTQLQSLLRCDSFIQAAESRIHEAAVQFIADIRSREKQLVNDLHGLYGVELMDRVRRMEEMRGGLDNLKSTCNLTELVLKGKDMELLLLKKQVQDKMGSLVKVTLADLPPSVYKHVAFVPGSVDLGELSDGKDDNHHHENNHHHPHHLRTQLSLPSGFSSSSSSSSNGLTVCCSEAQTDMPGERRQQARLVSRYIQTQSPQPRDLHEDLADESGTSPGHREARAWGGGLKSTVGTGTDLIHTQEKGVSTRSRLLQQQQQVGSMDEGTTSSSATTTTTVTVPDPCSSPSARRARRRRERARQEGSTSCSSSSSVTGTGTVVCAPEGVGPLLSYSSSIEENHYG